MKAKPICCGYFERIKDNLRWMEEIDIEMMPYMCVIVGSKKNVTLVEKVRVKFCPICGKDVRGVQIINGKFKL
jgi:transcription initiation factor IIE alpha subunit